MEFVIDGFEHLNEDTKPLFDASLVKAARYTSSDLVRDVRLCMMPRHARRGWLEFLLVVNYHDNNQFVIGCIQRTKGGELEFHS